MMLQQIAEAEGRLTERFTPRLKVNTDLDRTLVSFQANKGENGHRWCKYKEGFSAALIRYILRKVTPWSGPILDPFAGSGTALFAASEAGIDATGIELLPSSAEIIEVRSLLESADKGSVSRKVIEFMLARTWEKAGGAKPFPHLRITQGAFPGETERKLGRYLFEVDRHKDQLLKRVLRFAALCILESVSFTRKDGQYLRWDSRSGRRAGGKPFDKGPIQGFSEAIVAKLGDIASDLAGKGTLVDSLESSTTRGGITLLRGSCLDVLPRLESASFGGIVTSPPYCNRYDYTRTYALELAMLGVDEEGIRRLRQALLSCTVENRDKTDLADRFGKECFQAALAAFESQDVLQRILQYLEACRADGSINNPGIPRMVRNYFLEMACVIFECRRVLKPGAPFVMVNDNVRYQGAHVPVDLVLSDIAMKAGLVADVIWVLPRGKGNSSQQMGLHGREEIRKCVYVWRAAKRRATRRGHQLVATRPCLSSIPALRSRLAPRSIR